MLGLRSSRRSQPERSTPEANQGTPFLALLCVLSCLSSRPPDLHAQAITTASIRGTVGTTDGATADGARVTVSNTATGFSVQNDVRDGRFLFQGLEVGGPYAITVQHIAYHSASRDGLVIRLGESLDVAFVLSPAAVVLDPMQVTAVRAVLAHGGTAAIIDDSLLHRLPTLDRELYDFVRLVPQISTKVGFRWGFSGGGLGIRYNNFLINGVPERTLVNATASLAGSRSIPLDAVKEYQVLVAPYDVRYGDFAGALVNSVTRSGTNRLEGSAFGYLRNDRLARGDTGTSARYDRVQYGVSLGGPIVRDRLHVFAAAELQRLSSPAPGPFLGQATTTADPVPVRESDLSRLQDLLRGYGLEAGSAGAVQNRNPLTNVFTRFDLALPAWRSRAVFWLNYDRGAQDIFSRSRTVFPLSTFQTEQQRENRLMSVQLHTTLSRAGGGHNELLVSHRSGDFVFSSPVDQPQVRVNVPGAAGGSVVLVTGTFDQAQGLYQRYWNVNVVDNLTIPFGTAHVLTAGVATELFASRSRGLVGSYGTWTFNGLDALAAGRPSRYVVRRDFGSANAPFLGAQFAAYVGDQWQMGSRLSTTLGLRADLLSLNDRAPYNARVDSVFTRRTDELPRRRVHLSPRVGFVWDVSGDQRDWLRGGMGIFTGRPPPAWLQTARSSYGVGVGQLRCGVASGDRGPAPPFEPDRRAAPLACATGPALTEAPTGDVDLLASDLRLAQALRASLAYDRQLPWNVLATAEVLLTRNLSDFEFVNLNLVGPQGVDRHGRVLYGSVGTMGIRPARRDATFPEVIDLRNTSRNHSVQLSARMEKRFTEGMSAISSYTYSRVRDVQTPLRTAVRGTLNWAGRAVSGRHDDGRTGISLNDVPHRFLLAGTVRAPWRHWPTELAFYYVGESGSPFTYVARGAEPLGDLNADGSNTNDPIYVPRDARDPGEIRFSGVSPEDVSRQQAAFEEFITRTPCLRQQRGRHVHRNSCREPWTHTTVALLRQAVPAAGRTLEGELQVFNVLNLLHRGWGQLRVAKPELLEHLGYTPGGPDSTQPVFHYDVAGSEWSTLLTESRFQLQLALRYRF